MNPLGGEDKKRDTLPTPIEKQAFAVDASIPGIHGHVSQIDGSALKPDPGQA